jgi:importin subunit alpha-1
MSGTPQQTEVVLKEDPIPALIAHFSCSDAAVAEQAIWAIGNLLGESPKLRDELLVKHDVMTRLLIYIGDQLLSANNGGSSISALRNSVWATSNAVRGKPLPKLELVAPAIPVLASLISHSDLDVRIYALWTLGYICEDGRGNSLDLLVSCSNIVPTIISLAQNASATEWSLLLPALRILASFPMSSNPRHNAIAMKQEVISDALPQILVHPRAAIRKEALYIISNIAADEKAPLELLIESGAMRQVVLHGLMELKERISSRLHSRSPT